ncbi:glycosidase [candidate division WOR-3 bacterium]|nr:glycosidase [candidate division WOR-3 bacterium]
MPKTSSIDKRLWEKAVKAIGTLSGRRENKFKDIFTRKYLISPEDLFVEDYLRSKPVAAFNPGALERDGELLIFPRLVFDYRQYSSSVGVNSMNIKKVIEGEVEKPLKTRIILWPKEPWEFSRGCEDPRVCLFNNSIYMLYTAAGKIGRQAFAELNPSFEVKRRGYFCIGKEKFVPSCKDSAFVKFSNGKAIMLTRPDFRSIAICWSAKADLKDLTIDEQTLKPVISHEKWEYKVGWSTNVVNLSENKYLVGWHAVLKEDDSYRNGLAVVDDNAELLGISNYLLSPQGLNESYGDRTLVIFGDGLVKYGKYLIWIGGVSDYAIGIFITEIDEALENIRWIK